MAYQGEYGRNIITDLFLPNPNQEAQLNREIYGAGYVQGSAGLGGTVTEGRSPFGRLMQGLGIIGEPEARPMTNFEQMLYMQGQHERAGATMETEKQRIGTLQNHLDLVQDAIDSGQNPDQIEEMMRGLPQSMRGGFERQAQLRDEDVEYKKAQISSGIEDAAQRREAGEFQMNLAAEREQRLGGAGLGNVAKAQEFLDKKVLRNGKVKMINDLYKAKQKEVIEAGLAGEDATNLMGELNEIYKLLQHAIDQAGGNNQTVLNIAGQNTLGLMMQAYGEPMNPGEDPRIMNTGPGVGNYLFSEGYPGITPQPTQTPGRTPGPMQGNMMQVPQNPAAAPTVR